MQLMNARSSPQCAYRLLCLAFYTGAGNPKSGLTGLCALTGNTLLTVLSLQYPTPQKRGEETPHPNLLSKFLSLPANMFEEISFLE